MDNISTVKSVIHLYIPFKIHHTSAFRIKLATNDNWSIDRSLCTSFYLRYIDRIFNNGGIYSDCLVMRSSFIQYALKAYAIPFEIGCARIFSFDTSVAFLELSICYSCDSLDDVANLTSVLRLSNQKSITTPDGKVTSINAIASQMLRPFGKVTMFEHLGMGGETRPELLVSAVTDAMPDNADMHAYRIASGLDTRYNENPDDARFYSNFSYIKWAITERGVCNIGALTDNKENSDFIANNWLSYTDTRYVIWYMLVLHQKYSMYQYMNDIANKSTLGNLREFQKKIMVFNTKYRFSIVSEEASYQKLYEIMCDVKGLEREFTDIDEEIERISEYHESKANKNTTRAMTIISILCAVSAIKDFYEIIAGGSMRERLAQSWIGLSLEAQVFFGVFLTLIAAAMIIVLPKTSVKQSLKRFTRKIVSFMLNKKTK